MASVYSTRFIEVSSLTPSAAYTVPAGFVAVVRDLDAVSQGSVAVAELVMVGAAGQAIYLAFAPISTSMWFGWRGRQVLLAGETLHVDVANGPWDVSVSGYLLTAP